MQLNEILAPPQLAGLTDAKRQDLLGFMIGWLGGRYMLGGHDRRSTDQLLPQWELLAKLFPPRVPAQVRLFRLVTVPLAYAEKGRFTFKPALGPVSSWTLTLTGLDSVAGVATDTVHNYGSYQDKVGTARVGIEATIPGDLVLATTASIRDAFLALSYDFKPDANSVLGMDVDHYQDVLRRRGGSNRQYEYVVRTPPQVDATVVQIYRLGDQVKRGGNIDPHGDIAPRIRRMKAGSSDSRRTLPSSSE